MEPAEEMFPDKMLAALQAVECPVCLDHFKVPTLLCANGHSVCGSCAQGLDDCPTCRERMTTMRNYVLEDVLSTYFNSESEIVADPLKGLTQLEKLQDRITKQMSGILLAKEKKFLDLMELKENLAKSLAEKSDENTKLADFLNDQESKLSSMKDFLGKVTQSISEMEDGRRQIIKSDEVIEEQANDSLVVDSE